MKQHRTQVWSSGGGVQSSAIAALICSGKLKPDLCIIVDTEREQSTTWEYMDSVIQPALKKVGYVLHRVAKSEFEHRDMYGGKDNKTLLVPTFTNKSGDVGKLPNYCSSHWKRDVVKRWVNAQGGKNVDMWLGISTDEMQRIQIQKSKKWVNRYPLIEQKMNRSDCIALVNSMGWPTPPRSSCYHCPNHTQNEWREIKLRPHDWNLAIQVEKDMQKHDSQVFLHADCIPLDQVDLDDKNGVLFDHACNSGHCFT